MNGAEWPFLLLRSVSSGFFILLPLFVPPLLALPHIFSWTDIKAGVSAPDLVSKQDWLNSTAFLLRTVFYLATFCVIIALRRRSRFPSLAGPLLVLVLVLISFCSADWMMSLQPTFYSSLYPFLYFSGAMVSIFSVVAGTMAWLQIKGLMPPDPDLLLAYGKLLFAAVLFWGYIVFSQFIIIWTGNLPDEAEWYIVRSEPAWLWLTLFVLAGHFAVPFCILLSQRVKKNARQLLAISISLFVLHLFEVFWMMRPTPGEGFNATPFDLVLPLLIGAAWLWFVTGHAGIIRRFIGYRNTRCPMKPQMPNTPAPGHEVTQWRSRPFIIGVACFFLLMGVILFVVGGLTVSWTHQSWPPTGPRQWSRIRSALE